MKILIIGNGFDLNLGLKTSYKDFIESNQFKSLVQNKNAMAIYFTKKHEINNWVDIERELTHFSNSIDNDSLNIKEDFKNLKIALMDYLKEAQSKELNEDSKAFEVLKKEIFTIDIIINFNYTDSIFRIVKILNIGDIKNKHWYVHGSIENQDIIFGVQDNARVQRTHKFLKKAYNKNYGKYDIKNLFEFENEIIIFGHSLGVTDSSYFTDYINGRSIHINQYNRLTFHYYGESGWDEMIDIIDEYTNNSLTAFRSNNFVHIDSSIK